MVQKTRQAVAWLAVAGMVAMGSAASVGAQTTVGDGLIQVAIGDITITDAVDIGVAFQPLDQPEREQRLLLIVPDLAALPGGATGDGDDALQILKGPGQGIGDP